MIASLGQLVSLLIHDLSKGFPNQLSHNQIIKVLFK